MFGYVYCSFGSNLSFFWFKLVTVEPRYNEHLYNKVLGIMNDFLSYPSNGKQMKEKTSI